MGFLGGKFCPGFWVMGFLKKRLGGKKTCFSIVQRSVRFPGVWGFETYVEGGIWQGEWRRWWRDF